MKSPAMKCPRCDQPFTGTLPHSCPASPELICYCCSRCYGECEALAPTVSKEIALRPETSFSVVVFHEGKTFLVPELLDFGPLR